MGIASGQPGRGGAAGASRVWRAARDSVRVRWSGPMGPVRRVILVIVGALIMVALTSVGILALGLIVVGAVLAWVVLGVRRLWWAIIGRPTGGPDEGQNELRRNVKVLGTDDR